VFDRGCWYPELYDQPGWQAALADLGGHHRLVALRAGLSLTEEKLERGDHARARELAVGLAAVLDARVEERPGPMPYFMTDLRRSGARGIQRQAFANLAELLIKLDNLVAFEAWALREGRPDSAGKPG
jgi:hypothetical protein